MNNKVILNKVYDTLFLDIHFSKSGMSNAFFRINLNRINILLVPLKNILTYLALLSTKYYEILQKLLIIRCYCNQYVLFIFENIRIILI